MIAIRFVIACLLLACAAAQASNPSEDYFTCRKWVEQQCATNSTSETNRVFVCRFVAPRYASILEFRKDLTLREIVDQTPLKGNVVVVCVMRPDYIKAGRFTRHEYIRLGPSDTPPYNLKSLDVVWLLDEGPIKR